MPLLAFDNTNTNNFILLMLRSCVFACTISYNPAAVHGNKDKTELHLTLKHKVSHLKEKKTKKTSKTVNQTISFATSPQTVKLHHIHLLTQCNKIHQATAECQQC